MTYAKWFLNWRANRKTERLGQAFINDFVRDPWPELYYQQHEHLADLMIREYLMDLCYYPNVPHK